MLVDSSDYLGGQYWRHAPSSQAAGPPSRQHHGWAGFERLRQRLVGDPGCQVVTSAHVWSIDSDGVHVMVGEADGEGRESRCYRAAAVVLATGAHDRVLPVPGWDLPGVYSAGGGQALAKGEGVAIGRRVVVAGTGPFLLPVASSLLDAGCAVAGVFEAGRAGHLMRRWTVRPWELLGQPAKVLELGRYGSTLARRRVRYATGCAVTAIHGGQRVEAVTVSRLDASWAPRPGVGETLDVDAVCLGFGFSPRVELALAAGCRLDDRHFVMVDAQQRTSVPSVFAAGEITGIGGVDLALCEGTIAGHVAAGGRGDDSVLRVERRRRKVLRAFASRLQGAHAIGPKWTDWLNDDTVVCRCEEVDVARLRSVVETSESLSLRSLMLQSRAGLGSCQARICGRTVEELLLRTIPSHRLVGEGSIDRRPIASPVRLGEIAQSRAFEVEG